MVNDIDPAKLIIEIIFISIFPFIGALLIVSTKNGWNWLLSPKLERWYLWKPLSKEGETAASYLVGVLFILIGSILIIQRLIPLARNLGF